MTHDPSSQPAITSGAHPYVCPRCGQRAGIVDIATGISECSICGMKWRGPQLLLVPLEALATAEGRAEVVRQINAKIHRTGAHGEDSGPIEGASR